MIPSRAAALARLENFLPRVGDYAATRNDVRRDGVSRLSPYVTTRLLTEEEIARAALARVGLPAVGKFLEEVCWRTYWKGWLEMRPAVWRDYRADLESLRADEASPAVRAAREGRTGIAAFDAWARELTATGWLHNHARMWFASVWIFTLRLPWPLGAAFFLEHLLDGDAASNTLSWRWVAGLHTAGKAYLARSENIAQFSAFAETPGLREDAPPLTDPRAYPPAPLTFPPPPEGRVGVLAHAEDVTWPGAHAVLGLEPFAAAPAVKTFRLGALTDAGLPVVPFSGVAIDAWAQRHGYDAIALAWLPVGPLRDALEADPPQTPVHFLAREWDRRLWPHATRGFFAFRKQIPALAAESVST